MKTVSRMMLVAAASSLAIAPVAAQAGTRAGDSGAVYSVSAPGVGRTAEGESISKGTLVILGLLSGGLFIAGLIQALSSTGNGRSPGT